MIGGYVGMVSLDCTFDSAPMSNEEAAEIIIALAQYHRTDIPFGNSEIRTAVARAVALLLKD